MNSHDRCILERIQSSIVTMRGSMYLPDEAVTKPLECRVLSVGSGFGGFQSARTIHFFAAVVLVLFLLVHLVMIIKSGFKRQMRAMTLGK